MLRSLILVLALVLSLPALAEVRRYSDEALIDGFMKTIFGAEFGAPAGGADRVKKYARTIRINIEALPTEDLPAPLARIRKVEAERLIRQLATRIGGVRIEIVPRLAQANLLLLITDRRHYLSVGRVMLGEDAAFMRTTTCAGSVSFGSDFVIDRGLAIVVGDAGTRLFMACVAEEVLQVMGPVNDDTSLAYSTFNDRNELDGFPLFDQFILNMLYDRRVRAGMTRDQVMAVLPSVLRDIRPRVERAAARRNPNAGQALTGMHLD
jgi:hypothetical protein